MDGGDVDQHNKRVHEEYIDIIYKAWDQDLLQYKGEFYQVPFPFEEGISGWPAADWTRRFGAPGEIDEQGIIRGISVIPKPYQQPHPPAFQPFSVSESTIRHTAKVGVMPMILVSNPPDFRRLCQIYQEVAAENGRDARPRRERRRVPRRLLRQHARGGPRAAREDQLLRLQRLLRRLRLLGGVPLRRGRREVPARSVHAAAAVGVDDGALRQRRSTAWPAPSIRSSARSRTSPRSTRATASWSGSPGSSTRASCRSTRRGARSSCSPSTSSRNSGRRRDGHQPERREPRLHGPRPVHARGEAGVPERAVPVPGHRLHHRAPGGPHPLGDGHLDPGQRGVARRLAGAGRPVAGTARGVPGEPAEGPGPRPGGLPVGGDGPPPHRPRRRPADLPGRQRRHRRPRGRVQPRAEHAGGLGELLRQGRLRVPQRPEADDGVRGPPSTSPATSAS